MQAIERMAPGTILELVPGLNAIVLSDDDVLQRGERMGRAIGRVVVLKVGDRVAEQRFWYHWDSPEVPLAHIDLVWRSDIAAALTTTEN